jgi:outer membrane protein TolC
MEALLRAHRPRLYVTVSVLHNPTGHSLTPAGAHQLLQLAEERQSALGRQVELGRLASLVLVENQQNIFRRRALVTQSQREFETAANLMSLFHRDADGKPLVAEASQLPLDLEVLPSLQPDAGAVLELRPDLQGIRLRLEQAAVKLDYGQNLLKPRLDARFSLEQDVADPFRGRLGGQGTEAVVGLSVSVPLQRREARGKVASAKAEIESLRYRQQVVEEQVKTEIAAIGIAIDATDRLFQLSRQEQETALRMAAAERTRFQNGASDFFLVNLREEAAADAAVRQLAAGYERASARADLVALSADVKLLGLSP